MMNENEYFKCDCVYHKKGFILCDKCENIVNENNNEEKNEIKN